MPDRRPTDPAGPFATARSINAIASPSLPCAARTSPSWASARAGASSLAAIGARSSPRVVDQPGAVERLAERGGRVGPGGIPQRRRGPRARASFHWSFAMSSRTWPTRGRGRGEQEGEENVPVHKDKSREDRPIIDGLAFRSALERRFQAAYGGSRMRVVGSRLAGAVLLAATRSAPPSRADNEPSDRLIAASRLQETGNHREAIALLEQIREIDPRNPQVHLRARALALCRGRLPRSRARGRDAPRRTERCPRRSVLDRGRGLRPIAPSGKIGSDLQRRPRRRGPTRRPSGSSMRSASKGWAGWTRRWSSSKAASSALRTMRRCGARWATRCRRPARLVGRSRRTCAR